MKRFLTLLAVAALTVSAMAQTPQRGQGHGPQHHGQQREKMEAERIAYITSKLELTSEEAQAFWPVYNKAQAEQKEAGKAVNEKFKDLRLAIDEDKSDAEIDKLLKDYAKARQAKKDVMASYSEQFVKVLGAKKTAKLYLAEEGFRKQQIGRLGGSGQHGQGQYRQGGQRPQRQN